ncbi:hypothetical protein [Kurthia senegalensis]|uniref:hypothetical protein n=1 Tax=Kurthia senegalensis TaxID=1033740 RepID=UPI00028A1982|nr:hypothetical protein [Kurthia senegalensis]
MNNIFLNSELLTEQVQAVVTPAFDMGHCLVELSEVEATSQTNGNQSLKVLPNGLTLCLYADDLEELGRLFLNASDALKRAEKRD